MFNYFAANQAAEADPGGEPDAEIDSQQSLPDDHSDGENEKQARHGSHGGIEPDDKAVHASAKVARKTSEENANGYGNERGDDADLIGNARTLNQTLHHVTAKGVGSHPMAGRRRLIGLIEIRRLVKRRLIFRLIIAVDHFTIDCQRRVEHNHTEANHCHTVLLQPPPGIRPERVTSLGSSPFRVFSYQFSAHHTVVLTTDSHQYTRMGELAAKEHRDRKKERSPRNTPKTRKFQRTEWPVIPVFSPL